MLRKLALGLVAAVALGAAALSSTTASAGGHRHGGWHGHHGGWHGGYNRHWGGARHSYDGRYAYGGGGCYVRQLVPTPYGYRYRTVNRCY